MLLAGRCGMFRRSAVNLIGYLRGIDVKVCSIGKNYGLREFRRELRSWIEEIIQGKIIILYIEDYMLKFD